MATSLRKCANIKSKKHCDQKCTSDATNGDFCMRHFSHPTRFPKSNSITTFTPKIINKLIKIQRSFRFRNGIRRFTLQGPSTSYISLSQNDKEISSFDSIEKIPIVYRFSFADMNKHIWTFDIRSLCVLLEKSGQELLNPYTRERLGQPIFEKIMKRLQSLRNKKYCLLFLQSQEMSSEQLLHQRVVDICLKFDILGYYSSPEWFENLGLQDLKSLYFKLYSMFVENPVVNEITLQRICGEYLFGLRISTLQARREKKTIQYAILDIFEKLINSSSEKEYRSLGAVYALKAWASVQESILLNYEWLAL